MVKTFPLWKNSYLHKFGCYFFLRAIYAHKSIQAVRAELVEAWMADFAMFLIRLNFEELSANMLKARLEVSFLSLEFNSLWISKPKLF